MSDTSAINTVGHGGRSEAAFQAILAEASIDRVVDVRSYPASRRFPWFGRDALAAALEAQGIRYAWLGRELGGKRRVQPGARERHPALPEGLAGFADHMATERFARAIADLVSEPGTERVALLCAETDARQCHRWLIADYLQVVCGLPVLHRSSPAEDRWHEPSTSLRQVGPGALRYDRGQTDPLW